MKITVPPELERVLAVQAQQIGTTPEVLALDSLRERFLPSEPNDREEAPAATEQTLADFLRGHVEILHSRDRVAGGAAMSENAGKKFAAGLLKKRQAGRL